MSDRRVGLSLTGTRVAGALLSFDGEEPRIEALGAASWDGQSEGDLVRALRDVRKDLHSDARACFVTVDESISVVDRWEDTDGKAAANKRSQEAAYYHGRRVFRAQLGEQTTILVDPETPTAAAVSLVQVQGLSLRVRALRSAGWRPAFVFQEFRAFVAALPGVDAVVRFDGESATVIVVSTIVPTYERIDVKDLVEGPGSFESARRLAARAAERVQSMRGSAHHIEKIAIVGQRDRFESFTSALISEVRRQQVEIERADLAWLGSPLPAIAVERYAPEVAGAVGAALCSERRDMIDVLRADTSQSFAVVRETPHLRNGAITLVASLVAAAIAHSFAAGALASASAQEPLLQGRIKQDQVRAQYVDDVEQYTTTLADIEDEVQVMRASAHERALIASSILNALPDWVSVSQLKRTQLGWELDGFVPNEGRLGDLMETLRRVQTPYRVLAVEDGGGAQKGTRTAFSLKLLIAESQVSPQINAPADNRAGNG